MLLIFEMLGRSHRLRDVTVAGVAALMVLLYLAVGVGGYPLDDSWIHQTFARNLGERGEWAFVPGEPSGASTAPTYTVLLALGYALGVDPAFWTHLLGGIALAAAGMISARLADRAFHGGLLVGWLAGLAPVTSWHLVWAGVSGMETMVFMALVVGMILMTWREVEPARSGRPRDVLWRGVGFGMITAAMMATRPEGILLAGLAGLLMLWVRPHNTTANLYRLAGSALLSFALALLPYLLLNLYVSDGLLPDTSAAKHAGIQPRIAVLSYGERLLDMLIPVLPGAQVILLPGFLYMSTWMLWRALRGERGQVVYLLPLLWAIALVALYAAWLPHPIHHGRYVMAILPGWFVLGVIGTGWLVYRTRSMPGVRVIPLTLAFTAVGMALYMGLWQGPQVYRVDQQIINGEMVKPAKWIRENVTDDQLLAAHDVGALGYFVQRPIVDIAGLVTPEIVPHIGNPPAMWNFLQVRDADYLMAFPDQIPNQNPDDPRLCPVYQSEATAAAEVDGPKMTLYRLTWDHQCNMR